ncbi:MAG: hypothetical protein BGO07_02075 [Alphaproteobacteria bacterium 40-19]|nr:MAG: hypothetical protein BGO07_02075 [Alphaproteobacteria bacterium 40-19]
MLGKELILGLDPGLCRTGWGVLQPQSCSAAGLRCVEFGVIAPPQAWPLEKRLVFLHQELTAVCTRYSCTVAVVEKTFVNSNAQSALSLGFARAIAMMTSALHGAKMVEYSPTTIKKSLTGHGHASKAQMITMINLLLGTCVSLSDSADALAAAWCYGMTLKGAG